mmetsp:Transcript_17445/g.67726  ORF Transcript_17445/g.67726 Transcript_17445/m.67726 type:complete len:202 (-) Transcript_17445:342-947(-)|eukprot:CAMPEP_0114627332 /NCGR_PEP_ID=MMETSP0168-20121206/12242_1 /TAXON_ID=95228 ORGANISM="Vannella sp., Strain DIVA3 517/6/12" /NCGR_SAMPLE_ID=MMETSP0168 /ASSEMBLY_ACC=CAM_ASM_000044 /LENGTH=201 /DNA_ID=CAMNT_0001838663 /DNA_START=21 /DNA_END=626 /DNA_ORIENTATION=+
MASKELLGVQQAAGPSSMPCDRANASHYTDASGHRRVYKVLLVGDSRSGRSSFATRATSDEFHEKRRFVIQATFPSTTIHVNGEEATVQLWYASGEEKLQSLSDAFYKDAHGIFLTADTSSLKCIDSLAAWLEDIASHGAGDCPVVLLGTKSDASAGMEGSVAAFAEDHGIPFQSCSSRTGAGVQEALGLLTLAVLGQTAA